jgi:hypothetical protein
VIEVMPAAGQRRPFAQWGAPLGVRTASASAFAVPADLFPEIPEELLAGALVDGQSLAADAGDGSVRDGG